MLSGQANQPSVNSPRYGLLEKQLMEAIKNSLRFELYKNSAFLAKRLLAQVDNEDVRLLLAESYLGEGKTYKAYEVLKSCTAGPSRYKFALTCVKLNKLPEAERTLLFDRDAVGNRYPMQGTHQQNT